MIWLKQNKSVAYAGMLAGYKAGLHQFKHVKILVTDSPQFIAPQKKPWPTIKKFLLSLMADPTHDQFTFLLLWLANSYKNFHRRMTTPAPWPVSHCPFLGVAGDGGCGKTALLEIIIQPLLGGAMADPTKYLKEAKFNKDLFSASLLAMDDKSASSNLEERRNRVGAMKDLIWKQYQRMEGKGVDALNLLVNPFWRLVVLCNPGPGYNILPTADKWLRDKMLLLWASQASDLPTTDEDRTIFADRIAFELPGFAHFLLNYSDEGLDVDGRTRCMRFWHPKIENALLELQPEMRLLEMIDQLNLIGDAAPLWEGSASEFERSMRSLDKDAEGNRSGMLDRIFYNSQAGGRMLTELAQQTSRVMVKDHQGRSHYRIFRTEQEKE